MKVDWRIIPFILLALAGCRQKETPVNEKLRPVKVMRVENFGQLSKYYSGVVTPEEFSDLAFVMSGTLINVNVDAGDKVKKGQVVATLDPQDFILQLDADKANYETTKSILERYRILLDKEAISRQDYEMTQAKYSQARSAYEYSQKQLRDTKLRAPFDGFIARKYVENYQKVQAGQSVVSLVNPDKILVQFTLPENNLLMQNVRNTNLYVEFDNYKGELFKAKIKDLVEASPDGSGLPVTLRIVDRRFNLKKYPVAVGFSCRVVLDVDNRAEENAYVLPLSAVFLDKQDNEESVFIYNPATSQVERREVKVERLVNDGQVVVSEGIEPDELIVIAGVYALVDGQKVRVLNGKQK
ncbi:MAG: efflux RND transporter periplasmic adaptor subunit [Bacteroidales bacterium]|nr:efflux RND transporter periplasmic adaptor subunit [Bacteroidales bacterium]